MLYVNGVDPLYLQLCNQLRVDIENGKYGKGQKLLSERKLAALHDISRVTARMALQLLAEQGIVTIEPNKGALVL
jgi:DNA-binding GntR family transcriptional regulator